MRCCRTWTRWCTWAACRSKGPSSRSCRPTSSACYNLYEAARQHGVKRIVFASSNHVTGFYRQDEVIDARMPMRPDGHYGLSKAFGENLAQFYFDRYGLETVSLRIGSSFPEPKDRRMLATWMSYDDLERLVVSSLTAPVVGHTVIYGVSDNRSRWWDNTPAAHIGYRPQDSSERFRAAVEARQPPLDMKRPGDAVPGRRLRHQGPVRMSFIGRPTRPFLTHWRQRMMNPHES